MSGLTYVVPSLGAESETHFPHVARLCAELSRLLPTALLIERSRGALPEVDDVEVRFQRHATPRLARIAELVVLYAELARRGYADVFVRISQTAAVTLIGPARLAGAKLFYWHCGMMEPDRKHAPFWKYPGLYAAMRGAHRLVTGTEGMAEYYSSRFRLARSRIAVLPNDIAVDEWRRHLDAARGNRAYFGIPPDATVVLLLGRLSPIRRTDWYMAALARLARARPQLFLLIVGGGPASDIVRRALSDWPPERLRFVGSVPHQHVHSYYALADIFALPTYAEGFPRVLLEAMASGLPIVATDAGGVPEILPAAQLPFVVARSSRDSFMDALDALVTTEDVRRVLSGANLAHVMQYDTRVVAGMLARVITG